MVWFLLIPARTRLSYICWRVLVLLRDAVWVVEEREHLILRVVRVFIFFLVWPVIERGIKSLIFLTLALIGGLFLVTNIVFVYVLFEIAVVPLVLIIVGWGLQPERLSATNYLLIYTLVFSLPFLAVVILIETKWNILITVPRVRIIIRFAFIVKTPLYFLHIWLPKAHVEAPTAGSIVLAGILLKIGGIGLIWLQTYCRAQRGFLFWLAAGLGFFLTALVCRFQRDSKALVAYSRVAHMNLGVIVIIFWAYLGDYRASVVILVHGFVRRRMLFLAGRGFHLIGSRLLYFIRTLTFLKEILFFLVLGTMVNNFSIPPSLGLFGEISALATILNVFWAGRVLFLFYFFLVAYYSFLFSLRYVGSQGHQTFPIVYFLPGALVVIRLLDFVLVGFL